MDTPEGEAFSLADHQTLLALDALDAFRAAQTVDALWDELLAFAATMEADLLSYHHHAPDFAPDHTNVAVRAHGFPTEWVAHYTEDKLYERDPIAQIFRTRVQPLRWSEAETVHPMRPEHTAYLAELRAWLKGDGVGLPAFGPSGRHGYVGIGRKTTPITDWTEQTINRLHWVVESFHMRWCEIVLMALPQDFALTSRELTILENMALGLSDEVICGTVGAQLDSVRRSIRTIMQKMGVSDRPSAILRGIGAGLLPA